MLKRVDFSSLLGKTIFEIDQGDDVIEFICSDGEEYKMYHSQSCCESVYIDDINGDLSDLIGSPILQADESINTDDTFGKNVYSGNSFTWTFYKLATKNGYVTIRWFGESNGYYSESVDLYKYVKE